MDEEGSRLKTEELYTLHLPLIASNSEKDKLVDVINSCVSMKQLTIAKKYLKLWENKYGKPDERVRKVFFSKKMKLKHGWNNRN